MELNGSTQLLAANCFNKKLNPDSLTPELLYLYL